MSPNFQVDFARDSLAAQALYHRALSNIRNFFAARGALEVTTPTMLGERLQDSGISNFAINMEGGSEAFLQASPEFAMKKLLARGHKDIFQLAKVFRRDERGALHNPEFTMLEWYRVDYDLQQLQRELLLLLGELMLELTAAKQFDLGSEAEETIVAADSTGEVNGNMNGYAVGTAETTGKTARRSSDLFPVQRLSYRELFAQRGIDLQARQQEIYRAAQEQGLVAADDDLADLDYDQLLDLLFARLIQQAGSPQDYLYKYKSHSELLEIDYTKQRVKLRQAGPDAGPEPNQRQALTIIDEFPAEWAGVAQVGPSRADASTQVAHRFELIWQGVELANGAREASPDDIYLPAGASPAARANAALAKQHWRGLPECCGVALGLDRLLMLLA